MIKTNVESQTAIKFKDHILRIIENPSLGMQNFYNEYGKFIKNTAFYYCKSPDKSEEVLNQVLVKVWKNVHKLQAITNPIGWLYRVTVNCAKDLLKKKTHLPLNENILAGKDEIAELLSLDSFASLISFLDEMEQQIMNYKFVMQYSFKEMSEIIGRPISTISSIYYRARDKIKEKLENKAK